MRAEPRWGAYDDDAPRRRWAPAALALLLIAAAAAGGYAWWRQRPPADAAVAPAPAPAPVAAAPAPPPPVASDEPKHPIEAAPAAPRQNESADAALLRDLAELLGQRAALAALQTDGFARRVVATIDNLGRTHASPRLWPVVPTSGRFSVQRNGDVENMAPANSPRYAGFVGLVEAVNASRAASFYKAHYGEFQAAYRELGYPRGHFNDRLVEVIDLLLATPTPTSPPALRLLPVKGPLPDERPWVRYEFVDPALEALPAGQKMLLRMSPDQATRLKAQLRALRASVAKS